MGDNPNPVYDRREHEETDEEGAGVRRRRSEIEVRNEIEEDIPPEPPRNVEERHQHLNHMFGFRPTYRSVMARTKPIPEPESASYDGACAGFGNVMWVIFFGWWLWLLYLVATLFMFMTVVGYRQGGILWQLMWYWLWPFGKSLQRAVKRSGESSALLPGSHGSTPTGEIPVYLRYGGNVFYCLVAPVLLLGHLICSALCWWVVVLIPMSKVNWNGFKALLQDPLNLFVHDGAPDFRGDVVIYAGQAANVHYYKHTVWGINVILLNILPFVVITIIQGYMAKRIEGMHFLVNEHASFVFCVLSIVPLAYYIGLAVSSIAAQSTFAVGAFLNALFGSIIEIILFLILLFNGYSNVVLAGVTGGLLFCALFMPGVAMIVGGIKHRTQYFNARSAGVSSVLLIVSLMGTFSPTLFYEVYGGYSLNCEGCEEYPHVNSTKLACIKCHYVEDEMDNDDVYATKAKPLMYFCAAVLPLVYISGLLYTLKTHSYIYKKAQQDAASDDGVALEGGERPHAPKHDAPEWGWKKCVFILAVSTAAFAIVGEVLVDSLEVVTKSLNLSEEFVGITIISFVTNTAEFVNALLFALHNNVSLSFEVSSAAACQLMLLQVPVLVIVSAVANSTYAASFTLIFPTLNLAVVFFAFIVYFINSLDGRSNYFNGVAHVAIYLLLVASFYHVPQRGETET